jgi:hypothetical protein
VAQTTVTFRNGQSPTGCYSGTRDVSISSTTDTIGVPDANYNSVDDLVDGYSNHQAVLMKWDVSALPPGTAIVSASIVVNVINASTEVYPIYACLRPWVDSQATWFMASASVPWGVPGAQQAGTDLGQSVLGTLTGALGAQASTLNDAGIALVQQWVDDPANNHGVTVQNYLAEDGLTWSDNETGMQAKRPQLHVVYNTGSTIDFQQGVSPTAMYAGARDTVLGFGPANPDVNIDGLGLIAETSNTSEPAALLIRFDVSAIPPTATITSAALVLSVFGTGGSGSFPVYESLRPWSDSGATWRSYSAGNLWTGLGGDGAGDHGTTSLGVVSVATGALSATLNASGVSLVQGWVTGTVPNNGLMIVNYAINLRMQAYDSEWSSVPSRPALVVTYTGGPLQLPACPDAGAGSDGGSSDAGLGGGVDGGPSGDAGGVDSGSGDGVLPPGGRPLALRVGCGCENASAPGWLLWVASLGVLARSRRAGTAALAQGSASCGAGAPGRIGRETHGFPWAEPAQARAKPGSTEPPGLQR